MKQLNRNVLFVFLGIMTITMMNCGNDDLPVTEPEPEPETELNEFVGQFSVESRHISGVQTFYDSIGNIVFQGFDTSVVSNGLIYINQIDSMNDTLIINSLINNFNHSGTEVKGIVVQDTLRIHHEFSTPNLRRDFIRGDIWFEGDSIFLNYHWDKSDIWSSYALPERGVITAYGN